jgi:phosphoglycolate phosphatase-like HAD superfamily hydrolase
MTTRAGAKVCEPALVLFDIDGTLVRRADPHHREALVRAVRDVTGLETSTDHIPVHGMLDPDILSRMLRDAGASRVAIRRAMPGLVRRAQRVYEEGGPSLERKTCPGVRLTLRRLERAGAVLGLVTGNLTRIGWAKLERAGLKRFFRFGAFGEMARDRTGWRGWRSGKRGSGGGSAEHRRSC